MAKVLVNYIYNKSKDEYEILMGSKYVYADMNVAVMETEDEIRVPLVVPIRGAMTVVDRAAYELINKKFKLVADENGNVLEDENGTEIWLPKDTDLSKLRSINGRLVMVTEEEPKKEEKKERKASPRKKTN